MSTDGLAEPFDPSREVLGPVALGPAVAAALPVTITGHQAAAAIARLPPSPLPAALASTINPSTGTSHATPFYFVSQGKPLFAWLHARKDEIGYDHGVIIFPPIGHEQLHAHRGLRHLAESLANRGIPVLRFDWFGTGDSAGVDEDADLLAQWLANGRDALTFMKSKLGLQRISVVALRLGGLLAVESLFDEEIENLVLWAPVASGRRYVRELQLIESTASDAGRHVKDTKTPGENRGIQAGGFAFTPETIASLSAVTMTKRPLKCRRSLVAFRDDMPGDGAITNWLSLSGVDVQSCKLPGMKPMLAEPHFTQVPRQAIDEISDWLVQNMTIDAAPHCKLDLRGVGPTRAPMVHAMPGAGLDRQAEIICERAWQLEQPHKLFGVLSEPELPARQLPLIVLLNSGSAYRAGASRLNVLISRRLATHGFRCLRFDLRGLGDSPADNVDVENETYPATAFGDVAAVLAAARQDLGHDRCVLLGLCSGAYVAFQAAVQFDDPMLVESILINPLTFFWRDGMKLDDPDVVATLDRYWQLSRGFSFQRLWKFVSGRSDVGYAGAARVLGAQLTDRLTRSRFASQAVSPPKALAQPTERAGAACGHPESEDLPRDLARVARAGRKLSLFLAEGDPGLTILNCQAWRQTRRLRRQGILSVTRIPQADHIFSRSTPREELIDRIAARLIASY